ncbi:hypothetical protein AB0I53_32715 [Saccharopolyspora sp. NPDC050389]|uniref:hypothetical protein n=1 Tax=Saccharopolyspora sp. NPDC050389 TaxID=3155516 RepID=UPI0033EF3134
MAGRSRLLKRSNGERDDDTACDGAADSVATPPGTSQRSDPLADLTFEVPHGRRAVAGLSGSGTIWRVDPFVSGEVAEWLSDHERALLRSGELFEHPTYQCLRCGQPGDMGRDETSTVVLLANNEGTLGALGRIHAACGPSAIHSRREVEEWARAGKARGSGLPDEVITTCLELDGVLYPAVIVVPSANFRVWSEGAATPADSCVAEMRESGFSLVELPGPAPAPVQRLRWTVRVKQSQLVTITRPGRTWWSWQEATKPVALGEEWLSAARDRHRVVLLVTGARLASYGDDEARFRAALVSAGSQGRLAGALVSVNGVKAARMTR